MADVLQPETEDTVDAKFTVLEDFNPLQDNTEKKSYVHHSELPPQDIPEPAYATTGATNPIPTETIQPSYSSETKSPDSGSSTYTSEPKKEEPKKEEPKSSAAPIPDAELAKTVDQILTMYEMYYPQLFLNDKAPWSPKFKKQAIDNLVSKKLIDPTAPIQTYITNEDTQQPQPVTIPLGNYFNQHNKLMDMAFAVKPEEKEALREPLIDVLKDQDIQLTPWQRLGIAFGIQTASRLILCMGINKQRSDDLNRFMQAHKEKMDMMEQIRRDTQAAEERRKAAEETTEEPETEVKEPKIKRPLTNKPNLKEALKKKKKQ